MGRKANPAVIGAFVIGALVLGVVGILVFGSGQLFKDTSKYVCFFSGTVDGLNVGAPVKFKGVEIGSVVDIRLRLPEQPPGEALTQALAAGRRIPVIIEVDNDRLKALGGAGRRDIKKLIENGLRAQLDAQSLVTGLLFVELRFYPESEAVFVLPPDSKTAEIPTIPTAIEQMQTAAESVFHRLQDVHIEKLVQAATLAIENINGVVTSPELKETLRSLPATVANLNQTMMNFRDLSVRLDSKASPLLESLKVTSDKGGVALDQARATLQTVEGFVEPESPLSTQLSGSLQEVSDAARALRLLADLLERNPSALVRGKDVTPQ